MSPETRQKIQEMLKNNHFTAWFCSICSIFLAIPLIMTCFSRPELELRYDWLEDVILFIAPIYGIYLVAFFLPKAIAISKAKKLFDVSLTEEESFFRFTCTKMQTVKSATKRAQILGAFLYDEEGNEYLLLLSEPVPTSEKSAFRKSLAVVTAKKYAETNLLCEVEGLPALALPKSDDAEGEE